MELRILVVDDDAMAREQLAAVLRRAQHEVHTARDAQRALVCAESQELDLVVTDVQMPRMDGLELFRQLQQRCPATRVIFITGFAHLGDAIEAVKQGAEDYLAKPFEPDELLLRVERVSRALELRSELHEARAILRERSAVEGVRLLGRSAEMRALRRRIDTIAPSDASVMIVGETGTGKELIARAIHEGSPRRDKPFVAVSCAALPETLTEAELFGHEKGAYTGAAQRRIGRFGEAHGGTLLLDEVGEIPLSMQAKLLRVIQERRVDRLGGGSHPIDVRLVCATHRDLKAMVADGTFRADLYYRINVVSVRVPALRRRLSDVPLLVQHFYHRFARVEELPTLTPAAWAALLSHTFPGNVRELEHAMQHAVVMGEGGPIGLDHLPADVTGVAESEAPAPDGVRSLVASMRDFERQCLVQALGVAGGARQHAADMLGISRKTLWEKLRLHGITASQVAALKEDPP